MFGFRFAFLVFLNEPKFVSSPCKIVMVVRPIVITLRKGVYKICIFINSVHSWRLMVRGGGGGVFGAFANGNVN